MKHILNLSGVRVPNRNPLSLISRKFQFHFEEGNQGIAEAMDYMNNVEKCFFHFFKCFIFSGIYNLYTINYHLMFDMVHIRGP